MKRSEMKSTELYLYAPGSDKRMVSTCNGVQDVADAAIREYGTDAYQDVYPYTPKTLGACAEEWIQDNDNIWWFSQMNGPFHTEECAGRD